MFVFVMFGSFGQVYQAYLARACEMRYRRFRHVEIVVVLWVILWPTTPCDRMFDDVWQNIFEPFGQGFKHQNV